MKLSTKITVTPILLTSISSAIEAMDGYCKDPSLIETQNQEGSVGECISAALTNMKLHQAILQKFYEICKEELAK